MRVTHPNTHMSHSRNDNSTRDRLKRVIESREPLPPVPVVEHKYAKCSLCTREIDVTAYEFLKIDFIDCAICRVAAEGVGIKRLYCSETCRDKDMIVYHHYQCNRPAIRFKRTPAPCQWGNGEIRDSPLGNILWIPGYKFHPPDTVVNGAATQPFHEQRACIQAGVMGAMFSRKGSCRCNGTRIPLTAAHKITVEWPHLPQGRNKTTFTDCCPVDLSLLIISFVNNVTNTRDCPEEMQMKIRAACTETLILIALLSGDKYTSIRDLINNGEAYNVLNNTTAELISHDTLAAIAVDSTEDEDVFEMATMASNAAIFRDNMRDEHLSENRILDDYRIPDETSDPLCLWKLWSETFKLMLKVEAKGRFKRWSPNTYATLFACTYHSMLKFAWADVRKQEARLTGQPIDAKALKACTRKLIDVAKQVPDLCGYYRVVCDNVIAFILETGYSDTKDLPQAKKYLEEILELDTVDDTPFKLAMRRQFRGKLAIQFRTARYRLIGVQEKLADDFESLDNVEVD
jgi:hypothetical protein